MPTTYWRHKTNTDRRRTLVRPKSTDTTSCCTTPYIDSQENDLSLNKKIHTNVFSVTQTQTHNLLHINKTSRRNSSPTRRDNEAPRRDPRDCMECNCTTEWNAILRIELLEKEQRKIILLLTFLLLQFSTEHVPSASLLLFSPTDGLALGLSRVLR